MKTKMSKVLALAASAVLLVCMLAVGFTASADVTYEKTVNIKNTFTPSGSFGSHGEVDSSYALIALNESATFEADGIITDWQFVVVVGSGAAHKIEFSKDGSAWDEVTCTDTVTGDFKSAWGAQWANCTGTNDAADGYKFVRITTTATNEWVPTGAPCYDSFSYNTAPITYAENVKVKTAFTADWGSHAEVDANYGLLPEGGSATFEAKGAITDYKFYLANGGGDSAFTVEFSKDGTTWDAATGVGAVVGTHNGAWGSSWVTYTGTNDAADAYKFVRVTSTKLNAWVPAIPFYDTFEYNYEEIAAPIDPVGTATDPDTEYDVTVVVNGSTPGVTLPDGTALGNGKPGAWIDPYYGLIIPGADASTYTFPNGGFITVDLGEAFTNILFDVAENITAGHGLKGDGYRWEKIEVSANGTDWAPLNVKHSADGDTVVGAGAFSMRPSTYSATVDAAAGYRYVRLSYEATCPWGFITPAIANIKYDRAVQPVGTAGAPKDSYENTKDFSTATTTPDGTSLTGDIPGVGGTNAGDGYVCLTTPTSGLCVPGTITLNIGEVFTDISIVGMQHNASDGFMKFEVSADGETWAPLNVQKNDTGNKHAIGGWDISYLTFNSTVDADAGYKYIRITVVGCPWAMPSPAVKEVKYNVPPAPWSPDLSDNATKVDDTIQAGGNSGFVGAPQSYGFLSNAGNPNQNGGGGYTGNLAHPDYLATGYIYWLHSSYKTSNARFAFEVNSPKDFEFLVSIGGEVKPEDVIKVYAADAFEGGELRADFSCDPATPVNAKEIKVTFEKDAKQGTCGTVRYRVKCAEDIPTSASFIYLVMDGTAHTGNGGHDYAVGVCEFTYTSDPITIVDLPPFTAADDEEMIEDMYSDRLTMADDGQAFSLTNLMRAAGKKFGTFNTPDDMLVLRDTTADGEIVYDLSAYHNYMNDTEGYKANVTSIDVRGWISEAAATGTAPLMSVMVSKDGETWTALEGDQDTVRMEQRHNGYYEYSLLFDDIDAGYSWAKVVLSASDAELSISDIQILYNEAAADDDDNNDDNNDDDNNDDGNNPDTGVVAPVAALVLATVSGAAVVINKKRR